MQIRLLNTSTTTILKMMLRNRLLRNVLPIYYLKLVVLDKSLVLSNLILSARARVNCCGYNWSCLDLLNWRLCNNKCVSNTIWLKMYLLWPFSFSLTLKSNASQIHIKLPVRTSPIRSDLPLEGKTRSRYRQFYIFLRRG